MLSLVYNEEKKENWVKRVIGLPGDTIYAKDDVVYVNGMPIEEPYLDNAYANQIRRHGNNFTEDFPKRTLKDNEYFLMGDNRIVSYDSRRVGPFKREDIRGKDVYVLFPFNKIKMVRNGGQNENSPYFEQSCPIQHRVCLGGYDRSNAVCMEK